MNVRITASSRDAVLWWFAFAFGTAALFAHFALIEMGNLPINPVTVYFAPAIGAYVHPLFSQNWNFFAPVPISEDVTIQARAERCTGRGACVLTPWYDISDPLIEKIRHNRFSSLEIIQLMLSNAAVEFTNKAGGSALGRRSIRGKNYYRNGISDSVDPVDGTILSRSSAAALRLIYPGVRFSRVQFGLAVYEFPRFTKRQEPDRPQDASFFTTEWQPFPNNIATFAL